MSTTKDLTGKKAAEKKGALKKAVEKRSGSLKRGSKYLQGMFPSKSREFIDSDDDSKGAVDEGKGLPVQVVPMLSNLFPSYHSHSAPPSPTQHVIVVASAIAPCSMISTSQIF